MRVNLVVAIAANGVIGRGSTLPWRLPADLQRFRVLTNGYPLVMGRLTHLSIGRVLPGRLNIVVSRNKAFASPGCLVAHDLPQALQLAAPSDEAMVIGGAEIYRAALPFARRIFLTEVHAEVTGDVFFPEFARDGWRETSRETFASDARHAFAYSFVVLEHRDAASVER